MAAMAIIIMARRGVNGRFNGLVMGQYREKRGILGGDIFGILAHPLYFKPLSYVLLVGQSQKNR
jgi:hypothetical protein